MKNSKNKNLIFFIVVALLICKNFAFANNEIGPGVNLETNISTVSCVYKPSSLPMPRKVDIRQKNIDSAKKYAIPPYAKIVDVEKIDDSIEGIDEDGDSADCNVTYLKPHIAYMQEEQIESINDKID
ncbi:MAG: hypothetical protein MJ151_02175, partial [Lachnospiraceae bacterium]|nr:hypothetical protein [Lachnospiraceae bacterium]